MAGSFFPKRAVHLDFHTMPGVYDVGRDFDPQAFARTLQEAHIEYITVFAKCNLGFAYYPTDVGIVHPGLKTDLLGPMVAACHERGIRIVAYINTGLDHESSVRHREWCKLNAATLWTASSSTASPSAPATAGSASRGCGRWGWTLLMRDRPANIAGR